MRATINGNEARITMSDDDALDLAARLIHAAQRKSMRNTHLVTLPMPINIDGADHDLPGVVMIDVQEDSV